MTGLPAASYADALYRDPQVAMRLAVARRAVLESELYAQAAIAEKAVADVLKAVIDGEQDYERMDDMAVELARAALRLRKRSRELARREPEAKPRPPIFCQECGVEVERSSKFKVQSSKLAGTDVEPGTLNVELSADVEPGTLNVEAKDPEPATRHPQPSDRSAEAGSRDDRTLADEPPVAHSKQKIESGSDGQGRPRPYSSEKNAETEDPGPFPQSASSAKSAVPSHRPLVEALPGGT